MKAFYIAIFYSFTLVSCQNKSKANEKKEVLEEDNIVSSLLIKSSRTFLTEDGGHIDEEFGSIQEFQKKKFKIEYFSDTINVQTVQYVNSCGNAIGWIDLKRDTLYLTTKEQSEKLCSSSDWYKYEYWILLPDSVNYIIKQGK